MIVFGLLATISVACEQQTHFRSSLLSLLFGGREATNGNASAVRRLPKIMKSFERVSSWASDVIFYLCLRICRSTSGSFSATFLSRKQVAGRSSSWVKPSKKSARNVCRYRAGKEKPQTSRLRSMLRRQICEGEGRNFEDTCRARTCSPRALYID